MHLGRDVLLAAKGGVLVLGLSRDVLGGALGVDLAGGGLLGSRTSVQRVKEGVHVLSLLRHAPLLVLGKRRARRRLELLLALGLLALGGRRLGRGVALRLGLAGGQGGMALRCSQCELLVLLLRCRLCHGEVRRLLLDLVRLRDDACRQAGLEQRRGAGRRALADDAIERAHVGVELQVHPLSVKKLLTPTHAPQQRHRLAPHHLTLKPARVRE
mmetsp:Transcript_9744/g.18943  ORF Transcript_9744/g.18943 Transcript_9744/m.18943 type:complete len:214 (-) Transcript_9744:8-649(-)